MNWSAIGRAHGIQGGNAGQVVREFAEARNIDVEPISSCTPKRKKTNRPCKKKLVGRDVSIPSNPPIRAIEAEIKSSFPLVGSCLERNARLTRLPSINQIMAQ